MAKTTVNVTEDDVWISKRKDTWLNPISTAMWRDTSVRWIIMEEWALALEPVPRRTIKLPADVIKRLQDFDKSGSMIPFSFEIDVPEVMHAVKSEEQTIADKKRS